MTLGTLPKPIGLSPLQQWRYYKRPGFMYDWLRQHYTDLAVLRFQGRDHVAVLTPDGIRQVFSADPNGYEVFWKEAFTGVGGDEVVFVLAGERHRRERHLFASTFNTHNYRAHAESIRVAIQHHIAHWQPGQTIRAMDTTSALWLDIIMHLFFGLETGEFLEEGKRIHVELQQSMQMSIVFFPALQRRWFPPWRRYARAKAAFSDWVNRYVMEYLIQGRETNDVVGHILNSREKTDHFQNDSYIRDAIYSFLGPGHQTTATGLAWALYELGRHPSALDKLRTELATLGTEPDLDLLLTLPYLSAICNETLRLHPIIAECARVPVAPMEVLGRAIPADLGLVISIVGIHHDAMLYPEPGQFMPERFIERTYSPFEFLPFGGGHRRCMGAGLAEYIMRIALAEIVSSWDFETAATDWDVRKSLTFGPKHGVLLRIKARRKLKDNK